MNRTMLLCACILWASFCEPPQSGSVTGSLQRYHPVTIDFAGPASSEMAATNPFRNYRLMLTVTHSESGKTYVVPGFFAADGDAAETGATDGNVWRVHFIPEETGRWEYRASFREGTDVALSTDPDAGFPVFFDGARGAISITETDKSGRDFRAKGMLRYVGERYLRFDNGDYFVKAGADSPENLLAYVDFDGTEAMTAPGVQRAGEAPTTTLHRYTPHLEDWNPGDPAWHGTKGRALIGALNYLASTGANAISFLTLNIEGDGRDVWPFVRADIFDRYDVSKLAQWNIIFTHADSLGLFLHFKTQETENDQLLDGGALGPLRKLYYRELVARFAHHNALNWNLGEENDLWEELQDPIQWQVRDGIEYLHTIDTYDHPVVIHSYPDQKHPVYTPLLGIEPGLDGASLQSHPENVRRETLEWIHASANAHKPWVVANDEQGPHTIGVTPDGPNSNRELIRQRVLWGNLMAGGGGVEYYFGYQNPHNDLNLEDWRSRSTFWSDAGIALAFFEQEIPFQLMDPADTLLAGGSEAFVLAHREEDLFSVYLPSGGSTLITVSGSWNIRWLNPATGTHHEGGITASSARGLTVGPAPFRGDAAAVLTRQVP